MEINDYMRRINEKMGIPVTLTPDGDEVIISEG